MGNEKGDAYTKIDLDAIGIPHGADHMGCKIILTTLSMDVCRDMKTNQEFKLNVLNEEEAWLMYSQNISNVIDSVGARVLAREVAKELGGLPLAIKTLATFMRRKTRIELWMNALCELQKPAPV
ncbi:hypothetical protein GIB67_004768 [Kingdonia uniflora]|uniref:NB-ARC domain-containing protein n=1 Tax=Kingdonia uniflora TaxID=39325 RepID=A0A7J7NQJ8_9MAGN|nr:hypothetical protein GIB67_004768 [Kingdonia uniflora]